LRSGFVSTARALSLAAATCMLLAGCGAAKGAANGTGGTTGGSTGGGSVIPAGATAAAQLKALKGCTPVTGDQERWLVAAGGANPKYTVPTGSPKVGTTLAGWPTKPMVTLGDCANTESWTFAAADAKNFYLAVQVDTTLDVVPGTMAAPWSGDCLQFAFDPQGEHTSGNYGPNDAEMGMLLLDGQPPFLFQNVAAGQAETPVAIAGGNVMITRKNGITLYEAAIPWSQIGGTVNPTFGFNLAVAAGGAPYQAPNWGYEWTQGIIENKSPNDFAQLSYKK